MSRRRLVDVDVVLPNWTWTDIGRSAPRTGTAVDLDVNGWQALVAFLAGPAHVFAVPAVYVDVRIECGDGYRVQRPPTAEERLDTWTTMDEYLAGHGVPPAPRETQWRLVLPPGREPGDLWRTCNEAVQYVAPGDEAGETRALTTALGGFFER